jgi:predicted enzyme related to lactoylglutathione lyase
MPAVAKKKSGVRLKSVSVFTLLLSLSCLLGFAVDQSHISEANAMLPEGKELPMFLGLRTAKYDAQDLAKAKAWYSSVLGIQPYFDQPFYVGFNVGGYELGIVPEADAGPKRRASGVAYWGVEDAHGAYKRLLELGATPKEEVQDVGDGILVGEVHDPFGNVLGIIQNPHFKAQGK